MFYASEFEAHCWKLAHELANAIATELRSFVKTCRAAEFEENGGELNCTLCGAVVEGQNLSSEVTFAKGAGGESAAVGQYVTDGSGAGTRLSGGRVYNQVDSHEKSLAKGRDEIQHLVLQLEITPHGDTIEGAHRLYRIALQRNFTRGRRTAQVAGACLYIFCRQEQKPFMLIDISDVLQINVFVLGGVFLQMCHLLRLEEHPMFSRPIDPSLYIHRFVHKLMGENQDFTRHKQNAVTNTALRLVKSMKRDWMQTGRRPSGICGAALFIATHIHGMEFTQREIVARIHIGEATLAKRVSEFATTAAGDLTVDEFDVRGREIENEQMALLENTQPSQEESVSGCRCIHIEMGAVVYSSGMCMDCYKEYLENAGGQLQGQNPPAYTRGLLKAKQEEGEEQEEEEEQEVLALPAPGDDGSQDGQVEADMHAAIASAELANYAKAALPKAEEAQEAGLREGGEAQLALALQPSQEQGGSEEERGETLSDMSDMDMSEFIVHDEDEIRQKEQMWNTMNRDYLEKQEMKKMQLEEAHQARTDKLAEQEAKEAGEGQKRGRGRPLGSKTKPRPEDCLGPSSTPLESAKNLLQAKKLTGKIDYENLERLFEDPSASGPSKKRKVGEAIQEREKRQADAAAAKRQRQQAALAADAKKKQRAGSSLMGAGLRSGLGSSSGLSMLGRFSKQTEEPTSPSRFRPTSPTATPGG
ncbi:hypothetical protein WJX82_002680 [Trebouxia sp. C0006]